MDMLRARKRFTEEETKYLIVQILGAVNYMHKRRVIHRDLKLGNIFIGDHMDVKIGDFGLATVLQHDNDRKRTICGTPNYIAPEVLSGKKSGHSYAADIWSIGIILYTMLFGKPPFQSKDVSDIYDRIKHNDYSFPKNINVSEDGMDLIKKILLSDPEKRLTIAGILEHRFFQHAFPPMVPLFALLKRPNFGAISDDDSRGNFISCQIFSRLRLPEKEKEVEVKPVDDKVEDVEEKPAAAVLPTSLSPASTKDKYKMIVAPARKTGLDLKQQQQQKLRFTDAYTGKIKDEDKGVPRWTRAATPMVKEGKVAVQAGTAATAVVATTAAASVKAVTAVTAATAAKAVTTTTAATTTTTASSAATARAVTTASTRTATTTYGTATTSATARTATASIGTTRATAATPTTIQLCQQSLYRTISNIAKAVNSYDPENRKTISRTSSKSKPAVYVAKWVDFSDRYGVGYETTDGNVAVFLRNDTVIISNPQADNYLSLQKEDPEDNPLISGWISKLVNTNTATASESKGIKLLHSFHQFMKDHLKMDDYVLNRNSVHCFASPIFVTHYLRKPEYIMFGLNNNVYQFSFPDHIKIVLSNEGSQIDIIDSTQKLRTWSIQDAIAYCERANAKDLSSDPSYNLIEKLTMCYHVIKYDYKSIC